MPNPIQMILEFNKFRQTYAGDPKKAVEELLKSGKMSQAQYNELCSQAKEFQQMMQNFKL